MSIYTSLAVKYRPKKWSEIAGQEDVVTRLKGIIKSGKIPHAILFIGPSGTGKTTIGRMLTRYLNCKTQDACGECTSCKMEDNHPDVTEINAAEARGIDDVRAIIANSRYKPSVGKYRFMLVDEMQQLTQQAAQALLKPLEDAPESTIYILGSMEPEKIPPSVKNRCSIFELKRVGTKPVQERVLKVAEKEKVKFVTSEVAKQIAEASGGQLRDAMSLLESVIQYVAGAKDTKDITKLVDKAISSTLEVTDDTVAIKVLLSLYLGSVKSLHKALLDANDFNSLLQKMTFLNLHVLDRLLVPGGHANIAFWPVNKKFWEICKEKIGNMDESMAPKALLIQEEINQIKMALGTFLANERSIISSKLGILALKIKKINKKSG
jgi:DNA polymerase-3 subunit gamma/tau